MEFENSDETAYISLYFFSFLSFISFLFEPFYWTRAHWSGRLASGLAAWDWLHNDVISLNPL